MNVKSLVLAGAAALMATTTAFAAGHTADGCGIESGRISIIGNEFPAIQTVGANAVACGEAAGIEARSNLTADHQQINVDGMAGNPAEYTTAIIANSSIVALINADVIRPLNDLVEAYGQDLQPNQLIRVGDDILAIAFMANAQHLVYRADILDELGLDVPTTYEEMLDAAEAIRAAGILEYPVGGAYAAGWNLAQEFNNMFLGYGGTHFKPGTAEPNVNSEAGVKALEMMKALSEYMNPDFLTHDSNATNAEFRAGNVALMNMWGSRAATLVDADGVPQEVIDGFAIAGPMTVGGGDIPASTLWWDGWTVAKNISDEDAEATFKAMLAGIDPAILGDEDVAKQAVWLIEGYQPTEAAVGVFAAAEAGTIPYPYLPFMGLMHTALGNELADFMAGRESAEQALEDVEAAYTAAAREQGFLN